MRCIAYGCVVKQCTGAALDVFAVLDQLDHPVPIYRDPSA
jgi:hypothetical protein